MSVEQLTQRVAAVLAGELPGWEPGEVGRLADEVMMAAMEGEGARWVPQCGVRWPYAVGDAEVTRLKGCWVAEDIAGGGHGEHVHRAVLETPWVPHQADMVPVRPPDDVAPLVDRTGSQGGRVKRQAWEWVAFGVATVVLLAAIVSLKSHWIGTWVFAVVLLLVAGTFGALSIRPQDPPRTDGREPQHRKDGRQ